MYSTPSFFHFFTSVEINLETVFQPSFSVSSRERRHPLRERIRFMARVRLEPPWETYYKELNILIGEDPQTQVLYDGYEHEIKIYSENEAKSEALFALLPPEKEFGNVTITITVVPANSKKATYPIIKTNPELFRDLFKGNPAVDSIERSRGIYEATYIVFRSVVVQYFNDDIGDIHGNCSTLYQDIAKRIFENHEGVHFCTSTGIPGQKSSLTTQYQ